MKDNETITAISTPAGAGGIGVVRISGEDAIETAQRVFTAKSGKPLAELEGYRAAFGDISDGEGFVDEAIALVFRAPKSYTGEDVVELSCHGGELVVSRVLAATVAAGARPAHNGEFTKRAFLNGKMSLTQAEAVADLIGAAGEQGARAAASAARGALATKLNEIRQTLTAMLAQLSASIDFPEEDVEELSADVLSASANDIAAELSSLVEGFAAGTAALRGVTAAIVGGPNVGKSTLLNLLSGFPRAIVSPTAGTTRDVLEQHVRLGGVTLILRDTAGLRETGDEIERQGVRLAERELETAALVIAVFDCSRGLEAGDYELIEKLKGRPVLAVVNKTDLAGRLDGDVIEKNFAHTVYISALDPASQRQIDAALSRLIGTDRLDPDAPMLANERQRALALEALEAVKNAMGLVVGGGMLDAAYDELMAAHRALCELDGEDASEAVLDEVFSKFCVGK